MSTFKKLIFSVCLLLLAFVVVLPVLAHGGHSAPTMKLSCTPKGDMVIEVKGLIPGTSRVSWAHLRFDQTVFDEDDFIFNETEYYEIIPGPGYFGVYADNGRDSYVIQYITCDADKAPETGKSVWNGFTDGRINPSQAGAYAVYCKAGELQVWNGVTSVKVGSIGYDDISALANPASVPIGDNVYLGRSNNVLGVVIPGVYDSGSIDMTRCVEGDYDG